MDGTLLPGTSANVELARRIGVSGEVAALEKNFARGKIDTKAFARSLFELWGVVGDEVVVEAFNDAPKLRHIRETLSDIHERGHRAIVITMSPDFFSELFLDFGFDAVIASKFPRKAQVLLDPAKILSPADKPFLARDICRRYHIPDDAVVAYGDSRSDRFLFENARVAVSVNGDDNVKDVATCSYEGNDLWDAYQVALRALGLCARVRVR